METKTTSTAQCGNCIHYLSYYMSDNGCSFKKLHHGFCGKYIRKRNQSYICDNFDCKTNYEIIRKDNLITMLEQSLTSINCIAEVLTKTE